MSENTINRENMWYSEYLESEGLLNKTAIIKLTWEKPIKFNFSWDPNPTTINVKTSINRSSIVGTINFTLIGNSPANIPDSYEQLISSTQDNILQLGIDGKLYIKPSPETEFPLAVLASTSW